MRHLVCARVDDRGNGAILWAKEFKPLNPEYKCSRREEFHGYASSTPASDGERLYVFFGASGLYFFDLDGKELWHEDVGKSRATEQLGLVRLPLLLQGSW